MIPVPFVVGAVLGSAGTYVCKDEPARQWTVDTGKKLKDAAVSFIESMKKKPEVQQAEQTTSAGATVAEAAVVTETTVVADKPEAATQA